MKNEFKKLIDISNKCASYQTKNLSKSEALFLLIDQEVNKLKNAGINFSFECGGIKYSLPLNIENIFFRPLFKMATHAKIKEANADDTHAVDFDVPVGTEVYSVSDGIVTAIQSDSSTGGNNKEFAGKDNYLYIYNEKENRIYCYRHLERFSNLKLNSLIKKGMLLGRIGLTGYVITPHLHFVIYEIDKKGKYLLKSIPIKFIQ